MPIVKDNQGMPIIPICMEQETIKFMYMLGSYGKILNRKLTYFNLCILKEVIPSVFCTIRFRGTRMWEILKLVAVCAGLNENGHMGSYIFNTQCPVVETGW